MLMLTNKIPLRFSKSIDVNMLTGTTVAFYLEDTMGDLPDIRFTDVEDFREYWKAIEKEFYEVYSEIRQLKIENRELKEEIAKFKEWKKHIGDVKREDLDRVFKMSIYEITEAFEYYQKRIKELEDD